MDGLHYVGRLNVIVTVIIERACVRRIFDSATVCEIPNKCPTR
jgi:hypothetical protein